MSDVTSGEEEECNYAAIEKSKFGTLAIQDLLSAKNNSDWTCYLVTGVLIGSTLVPLYLMGPLSCYLYGMYNAICLSTSTLCNFSGLSIFACCAANRTFRRTAKKEQKKYDNQIDRAELIEAAYLFLKEVSESRARLKKYCSLGGGIEFSDRKLKILCLKIVYAHEAGYFIDRSFFDIHQEYQDVKTQLKEFHFIGQLANCKKI